VKVKYICDCCGDLFRKEELHAADIQTDFEALTGDESQDIILKDPGGSDVCISATCDECNRTLALDDRTDMAFYRQPLIH